MDLLGLNL
jgi:hypothetical protein